MFDLRNPLVQIVCALTAFVLVGITFLDFNLGWIQALSGIGAAALTELLFMQHEKRPLAVPWSALAAGLGIAIFFRAESPWFFALAGFLAIASKYVIRLKGRHLFNPSNFAIVALVVLFPAATTIEFTQWGSNPFLYCAVAIAAVCIAYQARVLEMTVSFVICYTALLVVSVLYAPVIFSVHHYGLLGPSFVLFSTFMITDPKTAPLGRNARIIHGTSIALLYFFLEASGVRYGLFLASFGIAALNALSALAYQILPSQAVAQIPTRNTPSGIVALALFLSAYAGLLGGNAHPDASSLSTKFLLFGIETESITACTEHPMLMAEPGLLGNPQTSNGAAWGDYDNDGFDDVFISDVKKGGRLYHNDHDGHFVDVTQSVGISTAGNSSAFFADYDNDGFLDLFIVGDGVPRGPVVFSPHADAHPLRVYKNTGNGHFKDETEQLGLSAFKSPHGSGSLSFADYNNDGYIDFMFSAYGEKYDPTDPDQRAFEKNLFDPAFRDKTFWYVCDQTQMRNIVKENPRLFASGSQPIDFESFYAQGGCMWINSKLGVFSQNESSTKAPTGSIGASMILPGSVNLFKNESGKGFKEVPEFQKTVEHAVEKPSILKTKRVSPPYPYSLLFYYQSLSVDYDNDGLSDIFLTSDFGTNILLKNGGGFRFSAANIQAGVNYNGSGMGADVADVNGDGKPDIVTSNNGNAYLFTNNGNGTFANNWKKWNIDPLGVGWGIVFADFNLDGWDDLFVANGDVTLSENSIAYDLGRALFRSNRLYENLGGTDFQDITGQGMCADAYSGKGLAVSDYDNNGTPDVLVTNLFNGPSDTPNPAGVVLYKNTTTGSHYLKIKLQGVESNRMGVGAKVKVTSNGRTQSKWVVLGNSFYSQSSLRLIFGLATSTQPVDVEVDWPSGIRTKLAHVSPDQEVAVREGQ